MNNIRYIFIVKAHRVAFFLKYLKLDKYSLCEDMRLACIFREASREDLTTLYKIFSEFARFSIYIFRWVFFSSDENIAFDEFIFEIGLHYARKIWSSPMRQTQEQTRAARINDKNSGNTSDEKFNRIKYSLRHVLRGDRKREPGVPKFVRHGFVPFFPHSRSSPSHKFANKVRRLPHLLRQPSIFLRKGSSLEDVQRDIGLFGRLVRKWSISWNADARERASSRTNPGTYIRPTLSFKGEIQENSWR